MTTPRTTSRRLAELTWAGILLAAVWLAEAQDPEQYLDPRWRWQAFRMGGQHGVCYVPMVPTV